MCVKSNDVVLLYVHGVIEWEDECEVTLFDCMSYWQHVFSLQCVWCWCAWYSIIDNTILPPNFLSRLYIACTHLRLIAPKLISNIFYLSKQHAATFKEENRKGSSLTSSTICHFLVEYYVYMCHSMIFTQNPSHMLHMSI